MRRVQWTDNILTEGVTCIHGYFTREDLNLLFELCPEGWLTQTFCCDLSVCGRGINDLKDFDKLNWTGYVKEKGFYFSFEETKGIKLIEFLKQSFPMRRGEPC
jgi:hypothetical protein